VQNIAEAGISRSIFLRKLNNTRNSFEAF